MAGLGPSVAGSRHEVIGGKGSWSSLVAMDDSGIDVQVLSLITPGVQNLAADVSVDWQGHQTTSSRR